MLLHTTISNLNSLVLETEKNVLVYLFLFVIYDNEENLLINILTLHSWDLKKAYDSVPIFNIQPWYSW